MAASDVAGQIVIERREKILQALGGDEAGLNKEVKRVTHALERKVITEGRGKIKGVWGNKLREAAEYNDRVTEEAIINNRAAAIEVDGQLVASGVYMEWAQVDAGLPTRTLHGRKIYMLTKGTTLPDFENRGYNKEIRRKSSRLNKILFFYLDM